MMNETEMARVVRRAIDGYFRDLDGEKASGVYDMVIGSVEKPLLDATLDEVAFSIQTLSAEGSAIHRRRSALESLYTLARDHGCLGQDTVAKIAVEVTK